MKVKELVDTYFHNNKDKGCHDLYIKGYEDKTHTFNVDSYSGYTLYRRREWGTTRIINGSDALHEDIENYDHNLQMDFLGLFMDIDLVNEESWKYQTNKDSISNANTLTILINYADFEKIFKNIKKTICEKEIKSAKEIIKLAKKEIKRVDAILKKYTRELEKLNNES